MRWNRREFLRAATTAAVAGQVSTLRALTGNADRMKWYREAKFGMFIHWGPYSVAGVEASWPILTPKGEITEAEYRKLPERFNPQHFDPHAWVAIARSAGQRYMVFTTKHHDGFCMFDSDYTSYKITRTPYGKDITAELAEACHADVMPLGLYYSPPDMNHPAYRDTSKLSSTNYRGEPERPEWPLYLDYMELQLHELLTHYGPVATLWFDSVSAKAQERYEGQRFVDEVNHLQPATLVNNRMAVPGDFVTPEQFFPETIPVKGSHLGLDLNPKARIIAPAFVPRPEDFQPWESCITINDTWAYGPKDRNFKPSDELIRTLIEVISRGGNFLLDVGPQPDGQIQPEFVERLKAVGEWTKRNAAAIYGTTYGPIQGEKIYRTSTRAASTFVYVMDESVTEVIVSPLNRPVHQARLVATGKPVAFHASGNGVRISVDKSLWEKGVPVVELR